MHGNFPLGASRHTLYVVLSVVSFKTKRGQTGCGQSDERMSVSVVDRSETVEKQRVMYAIAMAHVTHPGGGKWKRPVAYYRALQSNIHAPALFAQVPKFVGDTIVFATGSTSTHPPRERHS